MAGRADFIVVGAGPAGAAAAAELARLGYKVAVYEAQGRLAVKPCGLGVPLTEELPVRIPRDAILNEIRGARLYVDGIPAVEIRDWLSGFIVDKARMLESIIIESGSELLTRSHYDPRTNTVKTGGLRVDLNRWRGRVILAGGWAYYNGEKIAAVQTVGAVRDLEPDMLEIRFDTELLGYYWIFPLGDGRAEVGVGGYADPQTLVRRVEKYVKSDGRIYRVEGSIRGAMVAVGGAKPGVVGHAYTVGEAAGFVLPLTGEGIRPSMISGAAAARALAQGGDPVKAQLSTRIARAVRIHRRILEYIKGRPVSERREMLLSIPAEVHAEVALGTLRVARIARALASKPWLAARLLRIVGSGDEHGGA